MSEYIVTEKKTGRVISKGDIVTDFRGDTAIFEHVSRGPEYNGTAKVIVRNEGSLGWDRTEYYARVFGLVVTAK